MAGLRLSSRALNLLTAFKVLALVGRRRRRVHDRRRELVALLSVRPRGAPGAPPLSEALGLGLIGAFYSFGGFWEASRVAGEMRDPAPHAARGPSALGVAAVTRALRR